MLQVRSNRLAFGFVAVVAAAACGEVVSSGSVDAPDPFLDPGRDAPVDSGEDRVGCADGRRDGFLPVDRYPDVAACGGSWTVAGLHEPPVTAATCAGAGDDQQGADPDAGCAAANLCAAGWHVCGGSSEVAPRIGDRGCGLPEQGFEPGFYATNQASAGFLVCAADGTGANDLFGCGDVGAVPAATCAPLDRSSSDLCTALEAGWTCGTDGNSERVAVTKSADAGGGVLCCR